MHELNGQTVSIIAASRHAAAGICAGRHQLSTHPCIDVVRLRHRIRGEYLLVRLTSVLLALCILVSLPKMFFGSLTGHEVCVGGEAVVYLIHQEYHGPCRSIRTAKSTVVLRGLRALTRMPMSTDLDGRKGFLATGSRSRLHLREQL